LDGKGATIARRKFFAEAVGKATSRLRVAVAKSQSRIDALMGDLDRSAEESRALMASAMEGAKGRRARQVASIEREFGVRLAGDGGRSAGTFHDGAD